MIAVEMVTRENWREFLASPFAVLMLAKTDCDRCAAWTEELNAFLGRGEAPAGVRFGKLYLDKPGLIEFKKANPWIAELDVLPFNVIYSSGEQVKSFAGSGVDRLRKRLDRVLGKDSET
jgi:hypothetical protein